MTERSTLTAERKTSTRSPFVRLEGTEKRNGTVLTTVVFRTGQSVRMRPGIAARLAELPEAPNDEGTPLTLKIAKQRFEETLKPQYHRSPDRVEAAHVHGMVRELGENAPEITLVEFPSGETAIRLKKPEENPYQGISRPPRNGDFLGRPENSPVEYEFPNGEKRIIPRHQVAALDALRTSPNRRIDAETLKRIIYFGSNDIDEEIPISKGTMKNRLVQFRNNVQGLATIKPIHKNRYVIAYEVEFKDHEKPDILHSALSMEPLDNNNHGTIRYRFPTGEEIYIRAKQQELLRKFAQEPDLTISGKEIKTDSDRKILQGLRHILRDNMLGTVQSGKKNADKTVSTYTLYLKHVNGAELERKKVEAKRKLSKKALRSYKFPDGTKIKLHQYEINILNALFAAKNKGNHMDIQAFEKILFDGNKITTSTEKNTVQNRLLRLRKKIASTATIDTIREGNEVVAYDIVIQQAEEKEEAPSQKKDLPPLKWISHTDYRSICEFPNGETITFAPFEAEAIKAFYDSPEGRVAAETLQALFLDGNPMDTTLQKKVVTMRVSRLRKKLNRIARIGNIRERNKILAYEFIPLQIPKTSQESDGNSKLAS